VTSTFQFELVSPEALMFSKSVALVTVPGGEGDFGVLPGHAPMIMTVRPGVIDIFEQNDKTISERIFVAGGFAEVTGERCTILAEEAVPVAHIDRAQVTTIIANLSEDITTAKSDFERDNIAAKLAIANAKLQAIAA
jgi:F-type H+-transporting ATPase subunit epsilon